MGFLTSACVCVALSSLIAAEPETIGATTHTSAASANFIYVSDDGCILNEVIVFANRTTVVSASAPRATGEVTYTRYRYHYCEGADLGTDLGSSSQPVFSRDLNRALLNATIHGHTASGSPATISFALTWEGRGGITSKTGRPQNSPDAGARLTRSKNMSRNAAVSGSVDEQDISDSAVGASLHIMRKAISQ